MTSDNIKSGVMIAAIAAAAYVAWRVASGAGTAVDTVKKAAGTVGGWVNPASDKNLAYQAVNGVGAWASGDSDWSLGGAAYDLGQSGAVNPASPNNVIYKGVNGVGAWASGDSDWSLGGAAYDLFNPAPIKPIGYTTTPSSNGQKGVTGSW